MTRIQGFRALMSASRPGDSRRGWGGVGLDFEPTKAGNVRPLRSVAVFGHSYVSRLNESRPAVVNDRLIKLFWHRGATVQSLGCSHVFDQLVHYQPELTILIIGGNDITAQTQPKELAISIENLAKAVEEKAGGHCLIVGIEKRSNPRGLTADQFIKIRNGVNRNLRQKLAFARDRYYPMEMSAEQLSYDGVHLNQVGTEQLFQLVVRLTQEHYGAQ